MSGYLLVRARGRAYGLPLDDVVEVADDVTSVPMPETSPSVRGVVTVRGQMMPIVCLHAMLRQEVLDAEGSGTVVVVTCEGHTVALEVDDAEEVVRDRGLPVPPGRTMPWATDIAERHDELIPIVDLRILSRRLAGTPAEEAYEREATVR